MSSSCSVVGDDSFSSNIFLKLDSFLRIDLGDVNIGLAGGGGGGIDVESVADVLVPWAVPFKTVSEGIERAFLGCFLTRGRVRGDLVSEDETAQGLDVGKNDDD